MWREREGEGEREMGIIVIRLCINSIIELLWIICSSVCDCICSCLCGANVIVMVNSYDKHLPLC